MLSKLTEMLKRHEGFRSKPYRCTANKLTVGYGRNLDDVDMSKAEASFFLSGDTRRAIDDTYAIFPLMFEYTENRQMALINMAFNLGKTKLRRFIGMIHAINCGDWEKAADEAIDSLWHKQVGGRAVEIANLLRKG